MVTVCGNMPFFLSGLSVQRSCRWAVVLGDRDIVRQRQQALRKEQLRRIGWRKALSQGRRPKDLQLHLDGQVEASSDSDDSEEESDSSLGNFHARTGMPDEGTHSHVPMAECWHPLAVGFLSSQRLSTFSVMALPGSNLMDEFAKLRCLPGCIYQTLAYFCNSGGIRIRIGLAQRACQLVCKPRILGDKRPCCSLLHLNGGNTSQE